MAIPSDMTVMNITGKYTMSKALSDSSATDEILRLQGVGWFKRKLIGAGTLYLTIKHHVDEASIERIDIEQSLSGLATTSEDRILDWEMRSHEDDVFGTVMSRTRRIPLEQVEIDWLKNGWTDDTKEHDIVLTMAESEAEKNGTTWTAIQTWGFEVINGERRHVRHVDFTGPNGEKVQSRLVYDYQGPV